MIPFRFIKIGYSAAVTVLFYLSLPGLLPKFLSPYRLQRKSAQPLIKHKQIKKKVKKGQKYFLFFFFRHRINSSTGQGADWFPMPNVFSACNIF
jgi:hypothetical protein